MKMLKISECLIGLAVVMLQSCDMADNRRDQLCGNWTSMEGKPDVLIYVLMPEMWNMLPMAGLFSK